MKTLELNEMDELIHGNASNQLTTSSAVANQSDDVEQEYWTPLLDITDSLSGQIEEGQKKGFANKPGGDDDDLIEGDEPEEEGTEGNEPENDDDDLIEGDEPEEEETEGDEPEGNDELIEDIEPEEKDRIEGEESTPDDNKTIDDDEEEYDILSDGTEDDDNDEEPVL